MVRRRRILALLVAFGAYLVVSVAVWWNVWSSHPTSVTTCGCGDSSLFIWFLEWPAYALSHGLDPLYSTAMFHPGGINLLDNTSELALGVLLAPVTWLFGPVATLNVSLTLAPALSALAMFWLVRRWVSWTPAAFIAGLFYGFSLLVLGSLTDAHLMEGFLVIPPLIVGCLDELLVRQRRRPVVVGIVLGLLVVVQFFVGTETLLITAMLAVIGLVVIVASVALRDRATLRRRLPHAVTGLLAGGVVAGACLGYPVWFTFAGPAHLTGRVWATLPAGYGGVSLKNLWRPPAGSAALVQLQSKLGGYQGPAFPNAEYLGMVMLIVIVAGVAIWRRDRREWLFAALGLVSLALALGLESGSWVPWRVLAHMPVVNNIVPGRFMAMTYLCVAVLFGVVLDRVHRAVARRTRPDRAGSPGGLRRPIVRPHLAPAVALAVALAALAPIAVSVAGNIPLTVVPVVLPTWFTEVAPHLSSGQVVLAYPVPFAITQSALDWQAIDGMRYSMAGGGGPQGAIIRAGHERTGMELIAASSLSGTAQPAPSAADLDAVHEALAAWGVTMVVIPNQHGLPTYEQPSRTSSAVGLVTAVTGQRPVYQADAWVWTRVQASSAPVSISSQAFDRCVGTAPTAPGPPELVPDCVLAAGERG